MRSEQMALSPQRHRPLADRVDRLLRAAYADEPRFREAFLQAERGRRARMAAGVRDCDDSEKRA
jgi:hypothetical protein